MSRTAAQDVKWWLRPTWEAHQTLWTAVRTLHNHQMPRHNMYTFFAQLFGMNEVAGLGLTNYEPARQGFVPATLPFNLVRNGIKTIASKVGKNKPLPFCATSRGDYRQSKRARGITRYVEGSFHQLKVFQTTPTLARDALIFGTGILKPFVEEGDDRPSLRRVLPTELLVDSADARYGSPRWMVELHWYDRSTLAALYPDDAEWILHSSSNEGGVDDILDYDDTSDVVLVVEGWRLPPPKRKKDREYLDEIEDEQPAAKAKPNRAEVDDEPGESHKGREGIDRGRHVVAIAGRTLKDEDYTKNYFPFVMLKYDEPVVGLFGDSLASELSGFQYEINYVSETLHLAHRVVGTGIWLVPDGADVLDGHFQNDTGYILRYKQGFKPEYYSPEPASQQTYDYVDFLTQRGLNFSGISQASAQSQTRPGITAAKALQVLDEVEADRFAVFEQAWEEFHRQIADHLIDLTKDLAKEFPETSVSVLKRKSLLAVKWADVDLDRDAFIMQTWPTSLLARTPSARLQQVQDLFAAGIIDKTLFLKLLDAPDIDAETDLMAAAQMVVDEQIEAMLDVEDVSAADAYKRPDEWSDLTYAVYRGAQQVALGLLQGVPDANLDLVRDYVHEAKGLLDQKMTPANTNAGTPAPQGPGTPQEAAQPSGPQAPVAPLAGSLQGQAA